MDRIRIDSDDWNDAGKIYDVHSAKMRECSTAMDMVLEDDNGNIFQRVVAYHQIEWL